MHSMHKQQGERTLEGQVGNLEALVRAPGGRDDGGVADKRVVDTGVGDQIGLEFVEIDVEGTIEAQRRGDGRDNLSNQAVEMLVAGAGDVQVPPADIIDGLVVDQEGAVGVFDRAVGGKDSVVRLNYGGRHPRSRVDGELKLALLPIVGRQTLEEERTEARTGTTAKGVEDEETLEGLAVVYDGVLAHASKNRPRGDPR